MPRAFPENREKNRETKKSGRCGEGEESRRRRFGGGSGKRAEPAMSGAACA